MSIDLNLVDDEWNGWLHLLSPVEPYSGLVGETTADATAHVDPTGMLRPNWLPFQVEGDRMRFLGDESFFVLSSPGDADDAEYAELVEHAARQERSFAHARAYIAAHGHLVRLDDDGQPDPRAPEPVEVLSQLGGSSGAGNWVETVEFPYEYDEETEEDVWPLSHNGNRFQFVAAVPGWRYRDSGADWILLFFEPVEKLALLTFDWS